MNGLDYLILAVIGVGALYGLSRGALRMATSVASLAAAIYAASVYYPAARPIAERLIGQDHPLAAAAASYLAVFAAVFVAIEFVGGTIRRLVRVVHLGWLDRLGGGALGAAIAGAIAGLIVMLLALALPSDAALVRDSRLAPHAIEYDNALLRYIPAELTQEWQSKRADLVRYWLEQAAESATGGGQPVATPQPTKRESK